MIARIVVAGLCFSGMSAAVAAGERRRQHEAVTRIRRSVLAWLIVPGLLAAGAVAAHHSAAMVYDLSKEIEVTGVVTEYELGNPHLRIYFDVDNAGTIEKWMAEGGSRTVLLRKGWDGSEFKPGDRISMRGHPSRDGSHLVHLQYLTLPDGTERFAEDLDEAALDARRRRN